MVVAVSGGPDSLALLYLLKTISESLELKLVVAHLNHCLRPEANFEEAGVKQIAESLSLPHETRAVDIRNLKKTGGISEEEAGRLARYNLLFDTAKKYGASKIALGHQLDDQAETVLLNILRGTGVDGLAGILPAYKRGPFRLIRPLLCLRRSEIEAYCNDHNLSPFTDSSNLETDYTRNKLRLELIPRLEEEYNPRIREALFRLAAIAFDDRRFLQALARKKYLELAGIGRQEISFNRKDLSSLPMALSSRVLRIAHKKFSHEKELDRLHIERIIELVESDETTGRITLPGSTYIYMSQDKIYMACSRRTSTELPPPTVLKIPGKTFLPGGSLIEARLIDKKALRWPPPGYRAYLDYDSLPSGELIVRPRWPGARFYPQGSAGRKKLKDFYIDQKIPQPRRDQIPLVTAGNVIVWVVGLRIGHPYRVTERTERVLQLEFKRLRMPRQRNI